MGRRTKIVATIGPACRVPDTLARMVEAGMDMARLNFAHASREEHAENVELVRAAAGRAGRHVAVLQDLPGPKLRIGALRGGMAVMDRGDAVTLLCGSDREGDGELLSVPWPGLASALSPGDAVYLADGAVRLRVRATRPEAGEVDAEVEVPGTVASRQGLNIPGELPGIPSVPEGDLAMLRFGESLGVDVVALSFVRGPEDVEAVRAHTEQPLIAKIEKPQAVAAAERIVSVSDGVMVARGDLGIEMPIEEVPVIQKRIIALAGSMARPSITATQMLDSMVHASRPTRAEVTDVANAILDGTDALMLSQETAVGAYPVEAVATMAAVARHAEAIAPYDVWNARRVASDESDPAYALARGACQATADMGLAALVVPTLSGRSARLLSANRPAVPIYALSPHESTVRRCSALWGVSCARLGPARDDIRDHIGEALERTLELGWTRRGERVGVFIHLPRGRPGTATTFEVHVL